MGSAWRILRDRTRSLDGGAVAREGPFGASAAKTVLESGTAPDPDEPRPRCYDESMSARLPPADMVDQLSDEERARTISWWSSLNEGAQVEFEQMWDARSEDTALYGTCENGNIAWHDLPIELKGSLLDEENDREHRELKQQLLEYISNHEEVQFFLVEHKFHICRAHPGARAALRAGELASTFVCPAENSDCPMLAILRASGGRSVGLSPALPRRVPSSDQGSRPVAHVPEVP